jgi:hypothetical protein
MFDITSDYLWPAALYTGVQLCAAASSCRGLHACINMIGQP